MSNLMYADGALTAAVAVAAELAKNGGDLCNDTNANQLPTVDTSSLGDLDGEDHEEDADLRMTKSRERNREHARKTRMRKKVQLKHLQAKVEGLQAESKVLKQSLEECSIASILVGLSSGGQDRLIQALLKETCEEEDIKNVLPAMEGAKRKHCVLADVPEKQAQPLRIKIGGHTHLIGGGRTHINWKSGVYIDNNGVQKQLTHKQLESLRYVLLCMQGKPSTGRAIRSSPEIISHAEFLTLLSFFSSITPTDENETACMPRRHGTAKSLSSPPLKRTSKILRTLTST
jgi:hypothetical protein